MTRRPFNPLHIPRAARENDLSLSVAWRIWKHEAKTWLGIPYRLYEMVWDEEIKGAFVHTSLSTCRKRLIWNWRDREIWRSRRTTPWFSEDE